MLTDESFEWVVKIIASCQNSFHLACAKRLIEFFKDQYGECEHYSQLLENLNAKEPMIMVA